MSPSSIDDRLPEARGRGSRSGPVPALLLAAAMMPACGLAAPPPPGLPWRVLSGVVRDSVTGAGVPFIDVLDRCNRLAAMTDSSGRFRMIVPVARPCTLDVLAIGYHRGSIQVPRGPTSCDTLLCVVSRAIVRAPCSEEVDPMIPAFHPWKKKPHAP